jgi:hypothetical protein
LSIIVAFGAKRLAEDAFEADDLANAMPPAGAAGQRQTSPQTGKKPGNLASRELIR